MLDEYSIRRALRQRVRRQTPNRPSPVLLEEKGILRGRGRLDLVRVTDRIHGYEIKSENDHLTRLEQQAHLYGKVADRMTLVAAENHHRQAVKLIPQWWEVIVATSEHGHVVLKQNRRPRRNPDQEARSLIELLWLEESRRFLKERHKFRGLAGKPRQVLWDYIAEHFDMNDVRDIVVHALRTPSENR